MQINKLIHVDVLSLQISTLNTFLMFWEDFLLALELSNLWCQLDSDGNTTALVEVLDCWAAESERAPLGLWIRSHNTYVHSLDSPLDGCFFLKFSNIDWYTPALGLHAVVVLTKLQLVFMNRKSGWFGSYHRLRFLNQLRSLCWRAVLCAD